jgi:hypothetical protein
MHRLYTAVLSEVLDSPSVPAVRPDDLLPVWLGPLADAGQAIIEPANPIWASNAIRQPLQFPAPYLNPGRR